MIKLGDLVRDKFTGFTGIAWGRTEYMSGCARIYVQPNKLKDDGSRPLADVFEEPQLAVVEARNEPQQPSRPRGVQLGSRVKDLVTGFTGRASSRTEWLYAATRISIMPEELRKGRLAPSLVVDEPQIEVLEVLTMPVGRHAQGVTHAPGGPHEEAPHQGSPVRPETPQEPRQEPTRAPGAPATGAGQIRT